jgi:hypothetical protein
MKPLNEVCEELYFLPKLCYSLVLLHPAFHHQ